MNTHSTTSNEGYAALVAFGHSAAKAAEIVLDARRGDPLSQRWITLVRQRVSTSAESSE